MASIAHSKDGINWNFETPPLTGNSDSFSWTGICYGDDKFVAVGKGSTEGKAAYSKDGINWVELQVDPLYPLPPLNSVSYGLDSDIFGFL